MEDKSGNSKAGFVRNNFLQNDMMTLIDLETAPYK